MKLLMFRHNGEPRLGVLRPGHEDEVVDLSQVAHDLLALIDAGDAGLERARTAALGAAHGLPLKDVTLLPPLDAPRGNIIAMGRNYQKHAEETAEKGNVKPPTIFTKAITSITGPYDDIAIDPSFSDEMDWEVELGVVICRRGPHTTRPHANEHVFGYFVLNDVSARDVQNGWGGQYFKGKSLDRSCPTGPWVVTKDEAPDPRSLGLRLTLHGVGQPEGHHRGLVHPGD